MSVKSLFHINLGICVTMMLATCVTLWLDDFLAQDIPHIGPHVRVIGLLQRSMYIHWYLWWLRAIGELPHHWNTSAIGDGLVGATLLAAVFYIPVNSTGTKSRYWTFMNIPKPDDDPDQGSSREQGMYRSHMHAELDSNVCHRCVDTIRVSASRVFRLRLRLKLKRLP